MRTLRALLPILLMTPLLAQAPDLPELTRMTARFAPVELRVDTKPHRSIGDAGAGTLAGAGNPSTTTSETP